MLTQSLALHSDPRVCIVQRSDLKLSTTRVRMSSFVDRVVGQCSADVYDTSALRKFVLYLRFRLGRLSRFQQTYLPVLAKGWLNAFVPPRERDQEGRPIVVMATETLLGMLICEGLNELNQGRGMKSGIDIRTQDRSGRTALHLASQNLHEGVIEVSFSPRSRTRGIRTYV